MVRLDREARAAADHVIAAGGVVAGRDDLARAAAEVNRACEQVNRWVEERVDGLIGRGQARRAGRRRPLHRARRHRRPRAPLPRPRAPARRRPRGPARRVRGVHLQPRLRDYNAAERCPGIARVVQVGLRDLSEEEHAYAERSGGRIVQHHDARLAQARFEGEPWAVAVRRIVEPLPHDVYVSFDVDGLDPTLCPHTGTPVPGGLSFQEAAALVGGIVRSGRRIVGFDLVEVAPDPEGGEWDGNVGARLLYKLVGWMLRSQQA